MKLENLEQQKKEGGFTLVELAIVMIIIGLLIGGILKGQELIANSQTTATIAQIKGIDAATSTFRDKYAALPGDMPQSNLRLPNCANNCLTGAAGGNLGNGRIDGGNATAGVAAPNLGNESVRAFAHLAAADLLSGIDGNQGTLTFGEALPEAKVDGGFTGIEWANNGALGTAQAARSGHYLILNGVVGNANVNGATLLPARAGQIDRKLDDGKPSAGSVRSSTLNSCTLGGGVNATYNEGADTAGCIMYMRVQG